MPPNMNPTPVSPPSKQLTLLTAARSLAADVALLGGAALLTYGAWLTYQPAGFVTAGALALLAGMSGSRR